MGQFVAPRIDGRWVSIATNKQVILASVVSSYFHETGVYFPVFSFPSIDIPYSPSIALGTDGYFARVLGTRAAARINNALAHIQPEAILLLGLTETEKTYLRACFPEEMVIEIDSLEDICRLPFPQTAVDSVACTSSQIIEALLHAKFARKRLIVDDAAAPLSVKYLHRGEGIVLVENSRNVDDVAAINYAFAINSDVTLVQPIERQEIESIPRQLQQWSNDHSHRAYREVKRKISPRIDGIDFTQYKFATFFTVGLPYGLVLKNVLPCSHVLKDVACGVFIATNILEEQSPAAFDSALLFSPQQFASDETNDVFKVLNDDNYIVKLLVGRDATVKQLANYGGYFPFDVMHICAHGGETDGYYVIQDFTDRQGVNHKLEFYEVVGFSPADREMVHVTAKVLFKKLNGLPWRSAPLKAYPQYVFDDMLKAINAHNVDQSAVKRVRVNYPIAQSCHIKCHDSIHQGEFESIAGFGHPLVFNNTCSSSYELAGTLIFAGARSYIGTLWSVGNTTAVQAASSFYRVALQQESILAAFFAMNRSVSNRKYENVYILWGLHFSSLRKPATKSDAKIFQALVRAYSLWMKKVATTADPEVKRNSLPIARFLSAEIAQRFTQERLDAIEGFDPNAIEDYERSMPPVPEDDFSRGVVEIEVPSGRAARGHVSPLPSRSRP